MKHGRIALALGWLAISVCLGCQGNGPSAAKFPATLPAAVHHQELELAKDHFYNAVAGDEDLLPQAQQILDRLGGEQASDPQVVAYTGAAKLLQASHAPLWEKPGLGREGLRLEDKAVAMAPDDLEVRFLRGVTGYQLPRFLGRFDTATSDLAYVAKVAEQAARDGRLDPRAAAADLDYYGKFREENFDAPGAIAAWRAAVRVAADSTGGKDALKHLNEHHASG